MTRRTTQSKITCAACDGPGARYWSKAMRDWICANCLTPGMLQKFQSTISVEEKRRAQVIDKRRKARKGQFGWKFKISKPQGKAKTKEPEAPIRKKRGS